MEAALESLGAYLGLEARRPDNEFGTGPDVLWKTPGGPALSIEAKTGKGTSSVYRKPDLGQVRDHRQWAHDNLGPIDVHSVFVGPVAPASPEAHPDLDMVVIEIDAFREVRDRLRAALIDICAGAVPATAPSVVHDIFFKRGLLWPGVYDQLPKHILREIT